MHINRETMLFEDISDVEYTEMLQTMDDIVLCGKLPYPLPWLAAEWMKCFDYNETQVLLLLSTAFPQRVLLSLVHSRR